MSGIKINILTNFNGQGFAKLQRELKRLDTPIEKLGAVTRSLAPAAQIGLVALTALGGAALRAAEEAQVANNRLDSVARSMQLFGANTKNVTDRLKAFADQTMKKIAVDDELILSTQAQLLSFKNLALTANTAGGAFDRATIAAFDMAAVFGGSGEDNAVRLGKALQDPIRGVSALTKVGVQFTDQQKEQIKVLTESGNILGAQEIILKELEMQVGGAAEATATDAAKMRIAFGEMSESIGFALLPILQAVTPVIVAFFDIVAQNSGLVAVLAGIFGALAVAILAVNFALNANPIVKVITLVAALAAGAVILINYLVGLAGGWGKLFEGIQKGLAEVGSFFGTVFDAISNLVVGVINGLATRFENFINTIISGLNGIISLANAALAIVSTVTGGAIKIQVPKVPTVAIPRVPVKAPAKIPARIPGLALGGIVMPQPGGVLANIAEAGQPEAVIPLNKMNQFASNKPQNVYNINVNGGVGSGSTIGRAIVEAIKSYERTSGAVFVGA